MMTFTNHTKAGITNLAQLPTECEQEMRAIRAELHNSWYRNDAWEIQFVNVDGTRFFSAYRKNDFGQYAPGSCSGGWWIIRYGKITWDFVRTNNPFEYEYEPQWERGKCFWKSANGTEIPKQVGTKKEVIAIAKSIGIFSL